MLIFFICFVKAFFRIGNGDILNCNDSEGTSVIKIYVHLDEPVIAFLGAEAISRQKKAVNPFNGVKIWFGEIFDEVNTEMQPYGVQFHGDFTNLSTSDIPYDRSKCVEANPPAARAQLAQMAYLSKSGNDNGEIGNVLIVFFCPNNFQSHLRGEIRVGDCGNIMGFLFGNPKKLRKTIKSTIISSVFRTQETSGEDFGKSVCKISDNCLSKKSSIIGQYIRDLKSVRHISHEKFILKNHERLNEHDLYDDLYIEEYIPKNRFY